jgi:chromosome partitioning protein
MAEKNNVHRDLEEQLRGLFGGLVFETKIPRSIKLEEAHARHESILTYAPKSSGAAAYKALTEEILDHAQRQENRDGDSSGNPSAHSAA